MEIPSKQYGLTPLAYAYPPFFATTTNLMLSLINQ